MSYRTRSARRLVKKSRKNFLITLIIISFILFATVNWVLPMFINGVGFIKGFVQPSKKIVSEVEENPLIAAPVLNIPYEATNSSSIDISGYSTPNSKVKIFLDDEEKQTEDVKEDGFFTFKNVPLGIGTNNIYAKGIDENEKMSLSSKTFKIIYDNDKPSLSIAEPDDNKTIQGGDKKIKISGKTDTGAKVYINGSQTIVNKDGNFSVELAINEGDNVISIKAVDLASNQVEFQRRIIYATQ